MTINAGVWIDHHRAVVVLITDGREDMLQFLSEHDSPRSTDHYVAEDKRDRKEMNRLNEYYDEVIASLREADAILVVGPGEAKGEFTKRIDGQKLKGRVAHVETVDKMTDPQISAYVREHFH